MNNLPLVNCVNWALVMYSRRAPNHNQPADRSRQLRPLILAEAIRSDRDDKGAGL